MFLCEMEVSLGPILYNRASNYQGLTLFYASSYISSCPSIKYYYFLKDTFHQFCVVELFWGFS